MQFWLLKNTSPAGSERAQYLCALQQAQREYDMASSAFAEAVEPELIDEAIFLMAAARRKYSYLLKKVRDCPEPASVAR